MIYNKYKKRDDALGAKYLTCYDSLYFKSSIDN